MTILLVWALNRWNLRSIVLRFLTGEKLTRDLLRDIGKIRLIQRQWRAYWRRKELQKKVAQQCQSLFRMKRVQDYSFEQALGLKI